MGETPWWCLLEATLESMEDIAAQILTVYENRTDYYGVEEIIA